MARPNDTGYIKKKWNFPVKATIPWWMGCPDWNIPIHDRATPRTAVATMSSCPLWLARQVQNLAIAAAPEC